MPADNLRIYNIPAMISDAAANIVVNEETGELEGTEAFNEILETGLDKVADTARYLKSREFELAAMEELKKNLDARIKAEKKRQEWLTNCIIDAMKAFNTSKVEAPDILVKLAKKPESVAIYDEALVPQEFIKTRVEESFDKTAIKSAIKCGMDIPGACLVYGVRLAIK